MSVVVEPMSPEDSDRYPGLSPAGAQVLRMMREQVAQAQAMADSTRRSRYPEVSAGVVRLAPLKDPPR